MTEPEYVFVSRLASVRDALSILDHVVAQPNDRVAQSRRLLSIELDDLRSELSEKGLQQE